MKPVWPDRVRVLMSYAYLPHDEPLPAGLDIMVDSGAFTAYTSGKRIDVDRYIEYLNREHSRLTCAIALDVIGDPARSAANYEYMAAAMPPGISLMPTWHITSDIGWLEKLCERWDYVGVGGQVGSTMTRKARLRANVAAHRVAARTGTRLHGLGLTGAYGRRLPWYSVDSSSWTIPQRRPLTYVADRSGTMRSFTRGQPLSPDARKLLRHYGIEPIAHARWGSGARSHVGDRARSAVQASVEAAVRSYMWTEAMSPHRTRVYLATAPSDGSLGMIRRMHREGPPFRPRSVQMRQEAL